MAEFSIPYEKLDSIPRRAIRPYSPFAKRLPATSEVVAFVGVQLLRAFAWATRAATAVAVMYR
jgi:hypothetical protein